MTLVPILLRLPSYRRHLDCYPAQLPFIPLGRHLNCCPPQLPFVPSAVILSVALRSCCGPGRVPLGFFELLTSFDGQVFSSYCLLLLSPLLVSSSRLLSPPLVSSSSCLLLLSPSCSSASTAMSTDQGGAETAAPQSQKRPRGDCKPCRHHGRRAGQPGCYLVCSQRRRAVEV